ncbi:hypothetical protein GCM10011583_04530 [Streptomyces camponoticapitis]|uniref:Uncharacterized protein n=1 Tax=Streptomyces camponoticapitis TaxID=1616125 RepID=A0ABQ2DYL2_9ACTN|nr:hypothetical protein GCM10011583_04530 [Streptomyces camponoticapitis]
MRLPYLLLDVDSVLVPFPDDNGVTSAAHACHDVVPAGGNADNPITVWLNPDHGGLLMDVIRTGLVAPVWCTSTTHGRQSVRRGAGRLSWFSPIPTSGCWPSTWLRFWRGRGRPHASPARNRPSVKKTTAPGPSCGPGAGGRAGGRKS